MTHADPAGTSATARTPAASGHTGGGKSQPRERSRDSARLARRAPRRPRRAGGAAHAARQPRRLHAEDVGRRARHHTACCSGRDRARRPAGPPLWPWVRDRGRGGISVGEGAGTNTTAGGSACVPSAPRRASRPGCCLVLATASICCMATTKPVPVRIPPEMVDRIDALRGLVPREAYVRDLLDRALKAAERKARR